MKRILELTKGAMYMIVGVGCAVLGIVLASVLFNGCFSSKAISPRLKNGIDSIYTKDSIYYIHFTIDSAFEKESNNN